MKKIEKILHFLGFFLLLVAIWNFFKPNFGLAPMSYPYWPSTDAGHLLFDIVGVWFVVKCIKPYSHNSKIDKIFLLILIGTSVAGILMSLITVSITR